MITRLDHLVIVVRDLEAATHDYRDLGFTVTPGGTHTDGTTHNALIAFADGSYFELLAFTDPARPVTHPWWPRLKEGEGLEDFALASDDLAADVARCRQTGLLISEPMEGGRRRTDGRELHWRTARVEQSPPDRALPFVIEDVTPRDWRVPSGEAAQHSLPVAGIATLRIATHNAAATARLYGALLDTQPKPAADGMSVSLDGGRQEIRCVAPQSAEDAVAMQLQRHGEGPYAVTLRRAHGMAMPTVHAPLGLERAHGAWLEVAPE